jgi:zinc protease
MKIYMKKIFSSIIILSIAFANAFAQVDRSKMPEPGPAPKIEIGKYESFTLKNGLKVYVVENRKLPRVTFSLVLDNDPIMEKEKSGFVDMTGQLLKRGTKNRTKDQLDEEIDFIGASLSTSSSGVYASSLSKHTDKLLELMADVLLNPTFPVEEMEKIRKQTLSGLEAAKDNPDAISKNVSSVLLYGKNHPYGELTTEETVKNITIEDCKNYYNTYFKPNVGYLAIVGDITKADAEKLVKKHFGKWKKGKVPTHEYKIPEGPQKTKVALVDRGASVQSVVKIIYPVDLKPGHPDVIKSSVMNEILGGGASARLFQNLRETYGYTYGAYSSISSDKLVGNFSASANVRNEVTDSAIVQFIYELEKIATQKVTDKELNSVQNYLNGSFARSLESPQTVARFALSTERYKLPKDYYANYLKNLQAVTIEDVKNVASTYVRPGNAYILVVGKASEIADKLQQFGEVEYYDIYGNRYTPEAKGELPAGLNAEKVLADYIKAIGGEEKIRKVKDLKVVMGASIQGMDLEITNIMKSPDKLFSATTMGTMELMKLVRNGESLSITQQGRDIPMDDKAKKELFLTQSLFKEMDYKKNGIKTTLTGIEKVYGKDAYVIEIELPTGSKSLEYYDKESGLKIQEVKTMDTPMGQMTQATEFDDYKEVDGILYPHSITTPIGPQKLKATVKSVEINKGILDDIFEVKQ